MQKFLYLVMVTIDVLFRLYLVQIGPAVSEEKIKM